MILESTRMYGIHDVAKITKQSVEHIRYISDLGWKVQAERGRGKHRVFNAKQIYIMCVMLTMHKNLGIPFARAYKLLHYLSIYLTNQASLTITAQIREDECIKALTRYHDRKRVIRTAWRGRGPDE